MRDYIDFFGESSPGKCRFFLDFCLDIERALIEFENSHLFECTNVANAVNRIQNELALKLLADYKSQIKEFKNGTLVLIDSKISPTSKYSANSDHISN